CSPMVSASAFTPALMTRSMPPAPRPCAWARRSSSSPSSSCAEPPALTGSRPSHCNIGLQVSPALLACLRTGAYNSSFPPVFLIIFRGSLMRFVLALLVSLFSVLAWAQNVPPPALAANAWVLIDHATGQVLADKDPDARI